MSEELPTDYDVIVAGTGMCESILAAAAARVGKKVLHLDRRDYYSGLWSTFNLEGIERWIEQQKEEPKSLSATDRTETDILTNNETIIPIYYSTSDVVNVCHCWFTKDIKISTEEEVTDNKNEDNKEIEESHVISSTPSHKPKHTWTQKEIKEHWRKFNIDLAPKLLYSRGSMVELLISSNIARYAEFKSATRVLTWLDGRLETVPCSRSDVFTTRNISVVEKRILMKFLTICTEYDNHPEEWAAYSNKPFIEYLNSRRLTPNLLHYIVHSIAMVTTKTGCLEGLQRCQRFLKSLGRYGNTPFLWPLYGSGELPQCFCRMCAVFGGIYYLKRGIDDVIINDDKCVGVLSQGKRFNCQHLIMEKNSSKGGALSRAVFLTNRSLLPSEKEQITLLQFPPVDSSTEPVTIIEVGGNALACPKDLFLVHMTMQQIKTAQEDFDTVAHTLLHFPTERGETDEIEQEKPTVLWCLYFNTTYHKEDDEIAPNVFRSYGPGLELDLEQPITEAREIWQQMYPDEEFLPRAPDPEEIIIGDEEENLDINSSGDSAKPRDDSYEVTPVPEVGSADAADELYSHDSTPIQDTIDGSGDMSAAIESHTGDSTPIQDTNEGVSDVSAAVEPHSPDDMAIQDTSTDVGGSDVASQGTSDTQSISAKIREDFND